MSRACNTRNQQRGLSLVELMIAIALGLFLVWGVMQSFLSSRQIYNMQQGIARIQENGRLAQEFIGFDIRSAGDYGCGSGDNFIRGTNVAADPQPNTRNGACPAAGAQPSAAINMITTVNLDNSYQYVVYGFDNVAGANLVTDGAMSVTLNPAPRAGTDVLVLHVSNAVGTVTAQTPVGTAPVTTTITNLTLNAIPPATALLNEVATTGKTNDIAVSDCATTKIFTVPDTATTVISLVGGGNGCTVAAFQTGATVRKLDTVYYYVAQSASGNGYSLYKQTNNNTLAVELLEGVEDLQLQFGVDNAGTGVVTQYKTAGNVTAAEGDGWDWFFPAVLLPPAVCGDPANPLYVAAKCSSKDNNLVRAVRYSLLISSEGNALDAVQTIAFNGVNIVGGNPDPAGAAVAPDRRLRQVFTSTIGIRSRTIAP